MAKIVVRWRRRGDLNPVFVKVKETDDIEEIRSEMARLKKNAITPKLYRILQRAKSQKVGGFRNQLGLPPGERLKIHVWDCEFKIRHSDNPNFKIRLTV